MIEHELIMLVATFLLAASSAGGAMAWVFRVASAGRWADVEIAAPEPVAAADRAGHRDLRPGRGDVGLARARAFDRALELGLAHRPARQLFRQLAAVLVGMLHPRSRTNGYGVSAACLFVDLADRRRLGALMSFSSSPWYADYAAMGMTGIGLDPIDDQRLAGLVMWIPGGLVHGAAALAMAYKWLKASEGGHALSTR